MTPAQWERLVEATDRAGWPRHEVTVGLRPRPAQDDAPADWQACAARWPRLGVVSTRVLASGETPDAAVEAVRAVLSGG